MYKKILLTSATAVTLAGSAALGTAAAAHAASAPAPLPVTFQADGTGHAGFGAKGDVALTLGTTGTYAQVSVDLAKAGHAEPSTPPSFTTDKYAAGSPRWVVELSDGYYLFGYPAQVGATAKADFTGPQWQANGPSATACGGSYVTYAKALSCADPSGSGAVTAAFVVADADQAPGTTDTLTAVTYAGMTVGAGTVTVSPVAAQAVTVGKAYSYAVKASATSSDPALTYSAKGLPDGLSIDAATGVISGTVAKGAVSGAAVVTVTDAYDTTASVAIAFTVSQPAVAPQVPVLSHGHDVWVTNNRAVVAWDCSVAHIDFRVTRTGPGGTAVNLVTVPAAYYSGLRAGHTYEIEIQPLINGKPAASPGRVDIFTTR